MAGLADLADLADLEQLGILLGGGGVNELPEDEAEQQWWSECSASLNQSLASMRASCYQNFVELRDCWRSMCPLSKRWALRGLAFASFLENASTIGVMAVLTLNIYAATYFVAWAEHDSICVAGKDNTFPDHLKYWVKAIAVGLPFAACPITLYIAGQAKALLSDRSAIGCVSGLVIFEYLYILLNGALMTICMSASPYEIVGVITLILMVLVLMTWGCCCYHPQYLRSCIVRSCCCHEIDVEAPAPEGGVDE